MSVTTPCPENVTGKTLSTWSDGGLPEAEAARLQAHAEGCPACQERLQAFSDMSQRVRGQRIPSAPPVDVAAVRAGHRPQPAARHGGLRKRIPRTLWGWLGAAIAAALLIAAFSQVFANLNRVSPTTTPAPQRTTLKWEQRTLPPGVNLNASGTGITISPVTGENAWVCQVGGNGRIAIWATTDQARTWRLMSHLNPLATPSPIRWCSLAPDAANQNILALSVAWGCNECGAQRGASYVSSDNGATWNRMPGLVEVIGLATAGSHTYALLFDTTSQAGPSASPTDQSGSNPLVVSADGLHTWHAAGIDPGQVGIALLWANPTTGDLVASAMDNRIWRLKPGSTTWTQYTLRSDVMIGFGRWDLATDHWLLCDTGEAATFPGAPIRCTNDFGKTWTTRALLAQKVTCRDCGKGGTSVVIQTFCPPFGLAHDGAFISLCKPAATVSQNQPPALNVYRLAPGASKWTSLGQPPTTVSNPIPERSSGPPPTATAGGVGVLDIVAAPKAGSGTVLWYDYPPNGVLAVATLPS